MNEKKQKNKNMSKENITLHQAIYSTHTQFKEKITDENKKQQKPNKNNKYSLMLNHLQ